MKLISILILLPYIITDSKVYNRKNHSLSSLRRNQNGDMKFYRTLQSDDGARIARSKAKAFLKSKNNEKKSMNDTEGIVQNNGIPIKFRMDPVLNTLKRRSGVTRKKRSDSTSSSSSQELKFWKDEWKELWLQKKLEAMNTSKPGGDFVNMVAARPWGVPCGDPNQHDMPWGTCMLPMECESEYRIYRGDYFCGRSQFICCALQLKTYDVYQGYDLSLAESGLSTDSEERRKRDRGSAYQSKKRRKRGRKRRKKERKKRKRKIKRNIKKIVKEIKRILNLSFRNGTTARKLKTKELKDFIKALKKKYKKDRQGVKDIHETEMIKIDTELQKKLNEIRNMNQNFFSNATYRDLIVNGMISKKNAEILLRAYPEFSRYFKGTRRSNGGKADNLQFDVEYGFLYY